MKSILATTLVLSSFITTASFAQGYYPPPSSPSYPPSSSPGSANNYSYKTSQGQYGEYVSDDQGKAIYAYSGDTANSGVSNCYDQCAQAWPPVYIPNNQSPKAAPNAKQEYLGKIQRSDGQWQVTYKGWPCYYYAADQNSNEYKGHKANEYGGTWYLLNPDGGWIQ